MCIRALFAPVHNGYGMQWDTVSSPTVENMMLRTHTSVFTYLATTIKVLIKSNDCYPREQDFIS